MLSSTILIATLRVPSMSVPSWFRAVITWRVKAMAAGTFRSGRKNFFFEKKKQKTFGLFGFGLSG
jgi:hypothetical protein